MKYLPVAFAGEKQLFVAFLPLRVSGVSPLKAKKRLILGDGNEDGDADEERYPLPSHDEANEVRGTNPPASRGPLRPTEASFSSQEIVLSPFLARVCQNSRRHVADAQEPEAGDLPARGGRRYQGEAFPHLCYNNEYYF